MIEQCEKCSRYNSLGCPYDLEIAEKISDCDEYIPSEESKITDPIKKQLFTLLKDSPSLNVLYEEQWAESVEYLVSNGVTIRNVGEWIESYSNGVWRYECPFCKNGYAVREREKSPEHFCNNCGAKLDGTKMEED
jgi:ribosomal protein L37AE/L43A